MQELLPIVLEYFERRAWPVALAHDSVVAQNFGTYGFLSLRVFVHEEDRQVISYTYFPFAIQSHQVGTILEFLNRMNESLRIGNFELIMNQTIVAFRVSFCFHDVEAPMEMIDSIVRINFDSMDHAIPVLLGILYQGLPVAEAMLLHPHLAHAETLDA